MLPVCKYSAVFTAAFLLFGSAGANSFSLWDIAHPVPTGKFIPLGSGGDVFLFKTPGAGSCIGVVYQFYSNAGCTAPLSTESYLAVYVDDAHADKTFYIQASGLYAIANQVGATNAQCAKEADKNNLENVTTPTQITCSSETNQCTSASTQALPHILADNAGDCA